MSLFMDKDHLRQLMRAKRDRVASPIIYEAGQRIYEQVTAWSVFKDAHCVACYVSIDNEVDTRRLIISALDMGKQVCVPVTQKKSVMHFQLISGLDELLPTRFGLLEPVFQAEKIVVPDDLDLVIVPGLAFDRQGNRLGFGGGFYDRFLTRCSATRMGLAYAFQVVDVVPIENHDVQMDRLVTEDEVILCRKKV
jgi:5-formyltetrahydrofolate cyclo-ligase